MKVGYIRVSTEDQNLARQQKLMESLGVEKIFSEKISGKNTNRPQFKEMMSFLREGDTLFVESFSRLSRSAKDLLNTVSALKEKGVNLISNKEEFNTTTPAGKCMLTIFAAMSELERDNILERQREGISIAKNKGKYKGRKPIPVSDIFLKSANDWACGKIQLAKAVEQSGMSQSTFFRKCKENNICKVKNTTTAI